jgi:hypothetical protein
MMMLKRATLSAVALCLCSAISIHAAQTIVIGDFEDGTTQGWYQNGSRPIAVVPSPSPDENGSLVLEVDWGGAGDFDWSLGLDNSGNPDVFLLANTVGPQVLEFDIYWDPESDWTGDGWMQWTQVAYNYDGGWTQVDVPTSAGGAADRNWGTLNPAGSQHPEWDFIANGTPLGNHTGWAQLLIATNTGDNDPLNPITQGKFYIDNITITVPDILLGDVNGDGEVNGLDVEPFVELVTSGTYQAEGDMNGDSVVNGLDVDPFVTTVVGGGVQHIPEPSTLLLALIGLGVVGGWRKWGG